jgi:hypothetical protein
MRCRYKKKKCDLKGAFDLLDESWELTVPYGTDLDTFVKMYLDWIEDIPPLPLLEKWHGLPDEARVKYSTPPPDPVGEIARPSTPLIPPRHWATTGFQFAALSRLGFNAPALPRVLPGYITVSHKEHRNLYSLFEPYQERLAAFERRLVYNIQACYSDELFSTTATSPSAAGGRDVSEDVGTPAQSGGLPEDHGTEEDDSAFQQLVRRRPRRVKLVISSPSSQYSPVDDEHDEEPVQVLTHTSKGKGKAATAATPVAEEL